MLDPFTPRLLTWKELQQQGDSYTKNPINCRKKSHDNIFSVGTNTE